eukprot:SAG31_NODE_15219_length_764_cov_12.198496_1_plen_171_part_10
MGAAKLVSRVQVPDDAPPAPAPITQHVMGTDKHTARRHRHTTERQRLRASTSSTLRERDHRQTETTKKPWRGGGRAGAAKLVSKVRVPDDAPPAPAPSHSMSWAPTSTQQPADTAHHRASKPHSASTPSTLRQRETPQTDRQTDRDNKKAMARQRAGGRSKAGVQGSSPGR